MTREKGIRPTPDEARRERLARQLRDNLARRKEQARARRAGAQDSRDEGIAAAAKETTTAKDGDSGERGG